MHMDTHIHTGLIPPPSIRTVVPVTCHYITRQQRERKKKWMGTREKVDGEKCVCVCVRERAKEKREMIW